MNFTGKVWKYGDDVNTDVIFPGRYTYVLMDDEEMGKYALIDLDDKFAGSVQKGDIIVGGKNWGCGSSREQAVKSIKACGVSVIIAKSFARIFYRNAINEGLVTIICPELYDSVHNGNIVNVNFESSELSIEGGNIKLDFPPYPDFVKAIINDGGLVPNVMKKIADP